MKGKKEENVVEIVALRAMMKARYSVHNIGHYGLMFRHYTHFTSPIRRYPDLMVHRLLAKYAEGGRSVSAKKYEELCEHCSEREQVAATAERASIKYKQAEFMADRIGQEFDGVISGVTEFGIYVEDILTKCEGMVPLRDLSSDYTNSTKTTTAWWVAARSASTIWATKCASGWSAPTSNADNSTSRWWKTKATSLPCPRRASVLLRATPLSTPPPPGPEAFGRKKANKKAAATKKNKKNNAKKKGGGKKRK